MWFGKVLWDSTQLRIKPIIGADFSVQSAEFGEELTKLTVLAADNQGYKNLTLLISKAYLRGHVQHQPVIDKEWLAELCEGLILISGGKDGDVGKALLKGNQQLVSECVQFYNQYFQDRFYLELTRTGRADEENYLHFALDLAEQSELPVVATNDVVILDDSLFDAHEIRVAIHDGYTLEDPRRPKNYSPQQYLRSEEEMCELFADIPEALETVLKLPSDVMSPCVWESTSFPLSQRKVWKRQIFWLRNLKKVWKSV